MADRWGRLGQLVVGSMALLPIRLVTRDAQGATVALLGRDTTDGPPTVSGQLAIAADGTVTGAFTIDPREQPVFRQRLGLAAGDLLLGLDGQVTMVRAVGLGPDGTWWSPFLDGHAAQSQDGFEPAGHATPPV